MDQLRSPPSNPDQHITIVYGCPPWLASPSDCRRFSACEMNRFALSGSSNQRNADGPSSACPTTFIGTISSRAATRLSRMTGLSSTMNVRSIRSFRTIPRRFRRTLTVDNGKEFSLFKELEAQTGLKVYFADPYAAWQRGTSENTNGLLRQYFPKGTDLSIYDADEISAVAEALNGRPRKTLGWKTPAEALGELLSSVKEVGVATTG